MTNANNETRHERLVRVARERLGSATAAFLKSKRGASIAQEFSSSYTDDTDLVLAIAFDQGKDNPRMWNDWISGSLNNHKKSKVIFRSSAHEVVHSVFVTGSM